MTNQHPPRPTTVEVIRHETLFKAYSRLDRYLLRHEQYAGGMGPVVSREVLERGHAVAVLLFDPDRDSVVMIEQFRPGAYAAGMDPWLYEVVAGIIEEGETAEAVARRETLEEAGLEPQGLFRVQSWLASPGISSESIELWCGRVDSRQAGGLHGVAAEGEDIRVIVVPLTEVRDNLRAGRYTNAATLVALQWLLLNEDDIRKKI